jgi:peptidoglycan/xylan/chitin deacetylase (PgdA/CDA1 family)
MRFPLKTLFLITGILLIMTACVPQSAPTPTGTAAVVASATRTTSPSLTPSVTVTQTALPTATQTPIPNTPTITPTSWPLERFETDALLPGVTPASYIENTCDFLALRWGEDKSSPGTVVVPIMFHSILPPHREVTKNEDITQAYFDHFMITANEMGFETVTTEELAGFLYENARIPEKSMILILDDRRPATPELFMPYLEENDWTLTLAWPTTDATNDSVWQQMERLAESGRLDVQSHGHDHIYIQDFTPLEDVQEEIYAPLEVIPEHFGTTPLAMMWPGGNFTAEAIGMAKEAGYRLGFTAFSRGPLLFNWIPLGDVEQTGGNPLFVLPRYWSMGAVYALEHAAAIGEAASAQAEAVREQELRYYALFCESQDG